MKYFDFLRLIQAGEKTNVDFKVRSDVFAQSGIDAKAELAKDICAMANNGNVASYIVIGVSDDRNTFHSVTNQKLTDDNLQDFCKKAIHPPPKLKLSRERWRHASVDHRGKEFVIIQIGPQPRQMFRLAQDFIDYKKNVCYRRNEAWIRRNATTDLATPEEIARILNGRRLEQDELDPERAKERQIFAHASQSEQSQIISSVTKEIFIKSGYNLVRSKDWPGTMQIFFRLKIDTFHKRYKNTGFLVFVLPCWDTFRLPDLSFYMKWGYLHQEFLKWTELPKQITNRPKSQIRGVRAIWYMPIVGKVPISKVTKRFTQYRKAASILYFYAPELRSEQNDSDQNDSEIISSSEILIVDRILSKSDYTELLSRAINIVEKKQNTLRKPYH
jgi:hypothetical protein